MSALASMIEALGFEVAAIRKRGSSTKVELRGGERIGRAEGNTLYRFPLAEDLQLRDDTPIRLVVQQREVNGFIVSVRTGVLVIAIEEDLGPRIPLARLVSDDSFLIEGLRTRLEDVARGTVPFNALAAARIIGDGPIQTDTAEPSQEVFLGGERPLNDEQKAGVRKALGSQALFLWGPPGTGKTTTLARIVEGHYRAGRSVLLVSNTNVAVDTALEMIGDRLQGEPDFQAGAVLRQGPVVSDSLRQKFGPQVVLDQVVDRLGASLSRQKLQLEAQLHEKKQELTRWQTAIQELEHVRIKKEEAEHARQSLEAAREKLRMTRSEREGHLARIPQLERDLTRARGMGGLRRLLSGLNIDRLTTGVAAAQAAAQATTDAIRAITDTLPALEHKAATLRADSEDLQRRVHHYPSIEQCREALAPIESITSELREQIASLDRQLAVIRDEVLKRCRVLATTVYRTYLKGQVERDFDVAIIDEASMLMLPMSFYAAGLARHSVVAAGDFRQLPRIVMSDEPASREWLKKDVFEKTGVPKQVASRSKPDYLSALRIQYRMHADICAVVNGLFYRDSPLETHSSVRDRPISTFPLSRRSLAYVDTAPLHPWAAMQLGSYSRYNLLHALMIRNLTTHLVGEGFLAGGTGRTLGVIAPYAAQTRLIQALLYDKLGASAAGLAATVHRFQGNERTAMLIDLPDSFGAPLGRFMAASRLEEDGARLLNVAVSRAKEHVLLIANFDFLWERGPTRGIIRELLDWFRKGGEALSADDLFRLGGEDWIDGLTRVGGIGIDFPEGAAGAFTEGTFYPAFERDLREAREWLVIFSPYLTQRRLAQWADFLRAAALRGVHIRVVTRPPGDQGGVLEERLEETIGQLRQLGVAVDQRKRMHEKLAIIDGEVLWHGSLNILSHRDTSESMFRIPSRSACEQMARFVATPGSATAGADFGSAENPTCPQCGRPTTWNNGRFGVWFTCECGWKGNARHRTRRQSRR